MKSIVKERNSKMSRVKLNKELSKLRKEHTAPQRDRCKLGFFLTKLKPAFSSIRNYGKWFAHITRDQARRVMRKLEAEDKVVIAEKTVGKR